MFAGVCTRDHSIVHLNLTYNSTGRLSSPDYPLQFPPVGACYQRLKAPDGYRVKLQFSTINIQGNCKEDGKGEWIRVDDFFTTDFSSVSSFWGRFCSRVQPPVIYSTRNELQVFFTSNYSSGEAEKSDKPNKGIGFYATYSVAPQGNKNNAYHHNLLQYPYAKSTIATSVAPNKLRAPEG